MLRQGLRRAGQLGCASVAPRFARHQASLLQSIQRPSTTTCLKITTRSFVASSRLWDASSAGVAEQAQESVESKETSTISRFDDLHQLGVTPRLVENITKGFGYESMSPVQAATIAPALQGMDLVAQAKTGTGKTLGFLVPIIQRMIAEDPSLATRKAAFRARSDDIRGIVMSPTRELAEQIAVEAEKLCAGTGIKVQRAVGGSHKREMLQRTAREGCHLLVATPGRLNDLLSDSRSNIAAPNLAAIVLDEADRMLDVGFSKELADITRNLPDVREKPRQTLLFSATIPQQVVQLAREWVRHDNFDFIQTVNPDEALTHDRIPQHIVRCEGWGNTLPTLFELLSREISAREGNPDLMPVKAMVFLPSTAMVDLAHNSWRQMRLANVRTDAIHSKLTQAARTRAADSFRRAQSAILFTSDVTARGMDFPNVTHVIQIGAPPNREQYIHRLGRTGRQDKDGEGWLIISQSDIQAARNELGGLPIKPNDTLVAASEHLSGDLSELSQRSMEAINKLPKGLLAKAYMSLFAQVDGRSARNRVVELRDWFVDGMGFPNTPAMSHNTAQKLGIGRVEGLNIGRDDIFRDDDSFGSGGSGGGYGGRSFGGRDGGRGFGGRDGGRGFGGRDGGRGYGRSSDPFDSMSDRGSDRRGGGGAVRRGGFERSSF